MQLATTFKQAFEVMGCLVRRPYRSARHLSRLVEVERAVELSERAARPGTSVGTTTGAGGSPSAANPLWSYFASHVEGRGIWKWTHYFDIYERHLAKFVGRDVHVVEIGVCGGGSLEMWRHYFGSGCRVTGIDIDEACRAYEDEHTKILIGDQADRAFWRSFREQVPLVDELLDVGGHSSEQQRLTLAEM